MLAVSTAGTKTPPKGVTVIFTDPKPGSHKATPLTHPIAGYENCAICHYTEAATGSQFAVDVSHPCDECHAVGIDWDAEHLCLGYCVLPIQESCVLCHQPAS
jgi:hypothetical protein